MSHLAPEFKESLAAAKEDEDVSHAEESMENTRERGEYTNESDEGHASELTSGENEHGSAEAVEENGWFYVFFFYPSFF